MQTWWDFCLRESKQGFGSVEELSGAVYKGDQSGLLLLICLLTAIKPSLHIQTRKTPMNAAPYTQFLSFPPAFAKNILLGPGKTDEDILDAERGCRLHPSAISGSNKIGNRFLPLQCPVSDALFPLNGYGENREGRGKGRREEKGESKTSFFPAGLS